MNDSIQATTTVPTLLTQKELATWLRKSPKTLEGIRRAGEGPRYVKLGRHVRYRVADVLAWIAANEQGGGQ